MNNILQLVSNIEDKYVRYFKDIEKIAYINQKKVLDVFQEKRVESRHFSGTTGYGYGDIGRYKLEEVYAEIFGAEASLVRTQFGSATHAITISLRALLKPNDLMVSVTGKPYDTIYSSIVNVNKGQGSKSKTTLSDYGVKYSHIDLIDKKTIDYDSLEKVLTQNKVKMIFMQRSRGYMWREAISIDEISKVCEFTKKISPETIIYVDNCYGEFVEEKEPTDVGVDICAGSLIKNPGGGLAPTGAYIVGKKEYVDEISSFFYSPNIGDEIGSYESGYRMLFQGLFMAPHTVAQSLKGALLFAATYKELGYEVMPEPESFRSDITQSILLKSKEELLKFCKGVQSTSPVDSHLMPEPWDMPGYTEKIIMAAGTFVQGASIELSADAPVSAPYIVYLQGGLTYEHCKLSLIATLSDSSK